MLNISPDSLKKITYAIIAYSYVRRILLGISRVGTMTDRFYITNSAANQNVQSTQ